jgi:hypothetical protein
VAPGRPPPPPGSALAGDGPVDLASLPPSPARGAVIGGGGTGGAPSGGAPLPLESLLCGVVPDGTAFGGGVAAGGESDGYLAHIVRAAASAFGGSLAPPVGAAAAAAGAGAGAGADAALADPSIPLPLVAGRNADMKEVTLYVPATALVGGGVGAGAGAGAGAAVAVAEPDGAPHRPPPATVPLVFAAAYGFRNIQGVVAKLKRARGRPSPIAYAEVMACPAGGCVSGGGLARAPPPPAGPDGAAPTLKAVADAQRARGVEVARVFNAERAATRPADTVAALLRAAPVLAAVRGGGGCAGPRSPAWRWLLHTRYHAIPPMDATMTKW